MTTARLVVPVACALAGCLETAPEPDEAIVDSASSYRPTPILPDNPIEPDRHGPGVFEMHGSHLARLPVSWYLAKTITIPAGHRLVVRSECQSSLGPEQLDTGLYVVRAQKSLFGTQIKDARFNDDCAGQANCFCATCSVVDMGSQTGAATYDVYAFSMARTRARCAVTYSTVATPSFAYTLRGLGYIGGALVDVGPVKRAVDAFEVKTLEHETANDDVGVDDTRMLLFDIGSSAVTPRATYTSSMVPVTNDDRAAPDDLDPKIGPAIPATPIESVSSCDGDCPTTTGAPRHFVLIGREDEPSNSISSTGEVETTVALVRTPNDAAGNVRGITTATMPTAPAGQAAYTCGSALSLEPGRYSLELPAKSLAAYGEGSFLSGDSGGACVLMGYACTTSPGEVECKRPNDGGGFDHCDPSYFVRGHGNFRALRMKAQVLSASGTWSTLGAVRTVPNGAFGCGSADGNCWQTLREDVEVTSSAQVRLCVSYRDPRVEVGTTWSARRSPRFSELKVATFNTHHGAFLGGLETDNEYRNMANLLATRGRFRSVAGVCELADDGPFEWAADIVALQETAFPESLGAFRSEAEKQSDLDWRYVYGYGKDHVAYESYNSVYTHELMVPGGRAGDILPRDIDECQIDHDVTHNVDADGVVYCENHDSFKYDLSFFDTFIVPANVAVRRWGDGDQPDVPVMVYSVIMEPDREYVTRREELESMIRTIKSHLRARPDMFTTHPIDPTDPRAPFDDGIRIVLAGDFNFYPHEVGEHRWFVRRLREEFGYAVDTSAADRDSWANFYDMHAWRDSPYAGQFGLPEHFTSAHTWNYLDDATTYWWGKLGMSWSHVFPYWARTYHGDTDDYDGAASHERNDGVLLVGRGWAKDDPVRKYIVMHASADTAGDDTEPSDSPFAIKDAKDNVLAVDIYPLGDGDRDVPNGGPVKHYRPQYDIGDPDDACTTNGCAAVESDHIPVGVRLRITQ